VDEENDDYQFTVNFKNGNKKGTILYYKKTINLDELGTIFRPFVVNNTVDKYHIIIIYTSITSPALNSFKENISQYIYSELIEDNHFKQDFMSHPLVPEYQLLTSLQQKEIIDIYKTKPHLFPQMMVSDPISVIMNFRDGDMVKVSCYYNFTKKIIDKEMPPSITYCMITNKCE
jgi:DNA-directed RNA polymerase subunit H (RpoH/RPB5)